MKKRFFLYVIVMVLSLSVLVSCKDNGKEKYTEYVFDYFDTVTVITGYADDQESFDAVAENIKAQLREYHRLYTIYNKYEDVNNLYVINNSDVPVSVDEKIIDLLVFSKEAYALTGGQMNVAMGSVLSIWHRYREAGISDPVNAALPSMDELLAAAEHTDINDVIIDTEKNTVYLADSHMSLDVGAVAKGYAVERISRDLEEKGVTGYVLNVGGNVRTLGSKPDGTSWVVGIENPQNVHDASYLAYLHLNGQVLVTSGSYQRYYMVDGKTYHHIIDPNTLMPGTNFLSVSVLCDDSGLGDVLSTALFSMNFEDGLALVESIEGVEVMWVLPDGVQKYSSGFESYTFDYEG